jgi:hypothetical protein
LGPHDRPRAARRVRLILVAGSKRSLSLPIDRGHVAGVGAKYRLRDWIEVFGAFNYYDTGDSSVDKNPTSRSGRVVGKCHPPLSAHYALGLDLGQTFRL